MSDVGISTFLEEVGKSLDQAGGEITRQVDLANEEFRRRSMNGTREEREQFLKQCFDAARFNMRLALLAAADLRHKPRYDDAVRKILEATARQASETGFDEEQIEIYVETHRKAYESLAEEFGLG